MAGSCRKRRAGLGHTERLIAESISPVFVLCLFGAHRCPDHNPRPAFADHPLGELRLVGNRILGACAHFPGWIGLANLIGLSGCEGHGLQKQQLWFSLEFPDRPLTNLFLPKPKTADQYFVFMQLRRMFQSCIKLPLLLPWLPEGRRRGIADGRREDLSGEPLSKLQNPSDRMSGLLMQVESSIFLYFDFESGTLPKFSENRSVNIRSVQGHPKTFPIVCDFGGPQNWDQHA